MKFLERLVLFVKSLNPDQYQKVCAEQSLKEVVKNFFFAFALLFALMLLLFIPAAIIGAPSVVDSLQEFETINLNGTVNASTPITLSESPLVVVNLGANATLGKEKLLLTRDGFSWHPWYYFGTAFKSWEDFGDVKGVSNSTVTVLFLFLAPAIAFWAGLFFLAKFLLVTILCALLAWLLPRIWRHYTGFTTAFKVSFLAVSVLMLSEMLLFPFYRIAWLPFLLYLVFLALGVALVGEREFSGDEGGKHGGKGRAKKPRMTKRRKKSRAVEIWE